jgi:hypothetical protein
MLAGDPILEIFYIRRASGAVLQPDALPVATLIRNGVDTTVPVVVTAGSDGGFQAATSSLVTWVHGDVLHLRVNAVASGVPLQFTTRVGTINDANRPVIVFTGSSTAAAATPTFTADAGCGCDGDDRTHDVYQGDRWLFTITLRRDGQPVSVPSGSSITVVFKSDAKNDVPTSRERKVFTALETMPTADWGEGVIGLEIMPADTLTPGRWAMVGVRVDNTTYALEGRLVVRPAI